MPSSADAGSAGRMPEPVPVRLPITLGQFLKVAGLAGTGGEAKYLIVSGHVTVNGDLETRRGRHLQLGDTVGISSETVIVASDSTTERVHDR